MPQRHRLGRPYPGIRPGHAARPSPPVTTGFVIGSLARFSLLDSRQFRDPEPELRVDFTDPAAETIGVELVCTSVASDRDGAQNDGYTSDWTQHE
ncbi:hypothetical protein ACFQS2_10955 [Brachybacterium sp. GCM10030267]|uniref:hypothetical protein n=1 Tax=unclassified Brachybacterium TaxID=2623841 RepID=UPI00361FF33D